MFGRMRAARDPTFGNAYAANARLAHVRLKLDDGRGHAPQSMRSGSKFLD